MHVIELIDTQDKFDFVTVRRIKKKYILGNYTDQYYRSKGDINIIGNKVLSCWCTHTRYEGCHHCRRMTVYKHMAILKAAIFSAMLTTFTLTENKRINFQYFFFLLKFGKFLCYIYKTSLVTLS